MKDFDDHTLKRDFTEKKKILKEVFNPTSYPVILLVNIWDSS